MISHVPSSFSSLIFLPAGLNLRASSSWNCKTLITLWNSCCTNYTFIANLFKGHRHFFFSSSIGYCASRMPPMIRASNPTGISRIYKRSRMFRRWQTAKRAFSNLGISEWVAVQLIVQGLSYMRAHWLCAVKGGISTTETSTWVVKEGDENGIHACFFSLFFACFKGEVYTVTVNVKGKRKKRMTKSCICTNTPSGQFCAELLFFSSAVMVTVFFREHLG